MSYWLDAKNGEGMAEIYAFIFENLSFPEWYFVQYQEDTYFIQRIGK